jgi:hypothetical protein
MISSLHSVTDPYGQVQLSGEDKAGDFFQVRFEPLLST